MAVVTIMGILAALAITVFERRAFQSNVADAQVIMRAISVAEEHYRAENQFYLDVSTKWYPVDWIAPNQKMSFWLSPPDGGSPDPETAAWARLAPDVRQNVSFTFKVNAGTPGGVPPLETTSGITLAPTALGEPWYLIQARADADGDSKACYVAFGSWSPEFAVANEGE